MKKSENIISFIFIFVGSIFIIVSAIFLPSVLSTEGKIDTTGVITEMIPKRDSDGDTTYDVYVTYTVDGKEYTSKLSGYVSGWKEGKEIDIYYKNDNPEVIGTKALDWLFILFPILGGISVIVGVVFFIKTRGKSGLLQKLKETGMVVNANIVSTDMNYNYTVNGRHPYKIICEWFCPEENKNYRFESDNLWNDPGEYIIQNNITMIPVYINPNNKKQYALDIESVIPNIK